MRHANATSSRVQERIKVESDTAVELAAHAVLALWLSQAQIRSQVAPASLNKIVVIRARLGVQGHQQSRRTAKAYRSILVGRQGSPDIYLQSPPVLGLWSAQLHATVRPGK